MQVFIDAFPFLIDAWRLILVPTVLLYLLGGVVMGLCIGVFPGLGGIAGLSLILPFMFGLDPIYGLALMIGMVAVVPTSDTFASVLMGIPGSSASQATVLDGFPLARKARRHERFPPPSARLYLADWLARSFYLLYLNRPPHRLGIQIPELLMVSIFGLSMVGILAGRIALKGFVAAVWACWWHP